MKKNILILTWLLFLFVDFSFAQSSIQYIIKCDCDKNNCDTIAINDYDENGNLVCSFENDSTKVSKTFIYNSESKQIQENTFNNLGVFENSIHSYFDSSSNWVADSSFDLNKKLLFYKEIQRDNDLNILSINWKNPNIPTPFITQRIAYNELKKEIANTKCFGSQNCITQKLEYKNELKINIETWLLSKTTSLPILKESTSYIYNDNGKIKISITKSGHKDECIYLLFYNNVFW